MANNVTVIPLPCPPQYGSPSRHSPTNGPKSDTKNGHRDLPAANDSPAISLDFFAGPENRLIDAALRDVLQCQPTAFNPLVLYGPSGTGKSHLAQGLAAAWRNYFPGSRVICKSAVDFSRDLAEAIDTHAEEDFRAAHRMAHLAVFEDLGELATKNAAQEELICTLDALLACDCQVVATTRVPPVEVAKLLPALQSRLSSGLTVPIEPPGADARLEILRRWTSQRALRLSESILQLLAQELSGAVPELIGAMLQLEVTAVSDVAAIDRKRVKEFLSARKTALQPKASDVAMATARHFKLKLADMRGPSRRRGVVVAREVAMYLCRQLTNLSLQSIGHYFGDRDHTTVMHACRKTTELLQTDPAIREAVEVLEAKLSKV